MQSQTLALITATDSMPHATSQAGVFGGAALVLYHQCNDSRCTDQECLLHLSTCIQTIASYCSRCSSNFQAAGWKVASAQYYFLPPDLPSLAGTSTCRPLALRAAKILRPEGVAIRFLKPDTRLRFLLVPRLVQPNEALAFAEITRAPRTGLGAPSAPLTKEPPRKLLLLCEGRTTDNVARLGNKDTLDTAGAAVLAVKMLRCANSIAMMPI